MKTRSQLNPTVRVIIAVLATGVCFWAIWFSATLSLSRILGRYGIGFRSVTAANESVRLAPRDAQAHLTRAAVARASGQSSLSDLEHAVAMRPRDYSLWLELGVARDEANDPQKALIALNEAVKLAPFYARPLWQRGNVLLRMKRFDEAFADLRKAAASDPELVPNLIDLAWNLSQFDVTRAEALAQINTPKLHAAFAKYLARRNRPVEALGQMKLAGTVSDTEKKELVAQLIATNSFAEAYELWRGPGSSKATFYDGGFESPLSLDESGFGWRVTRYLKGAALSLDLNQPESGTQSLQVEFNGDAPPDQMIVSQFLMVDPARTYRVYFSSRTKDIVAGGLPLIRVTEADGERKVLGESEPIDQKTTTWRPATFTFKTGATTKAVLLGLQRQGCSTSPCPAFGALWLDSFSLTLVD